MRRISIIYKNDPKTNKHFVRAKNSPIACRSPAPAWLAAASDNSAPEISDDVKMTLGAERPRARASEARRFLSGCRDEFPTIGPDQKCE
jgi:hypothetical protein